MGLSNALRRLNLARAERRLHKGKPLTELELLRISQEMSHRTMATDSRFRSDLSGLLGLTKPESSTKFDRHTIKISRVAKDADILAEIRRLKASQSVPETEPDR